MKFIDIAQISVRSGDGGDGHVSFRKEKFVPKGGPDGGNGGRGGDVIFKADHHKTTLLDFKYQSFFEAQDGAKGGKAKRSGKSGKDLIISVPQGTIIKDAKTNQILHDLDDENDEFVIAKGGKGGFGNHEFATSTNQAPRYAKPGLPGEKKDIILELKLIADVGIIGLPNAGKSTLISAISAAKPKVADYPFTTLIPNLGIVKLSAEKNYTVADIPGLIEGAHEGKGLGHKFLRHIERTSVLLFIIDVMDDDPVETYHVLYNELKTFNEDIIYKKKIIALSKCDVLDKELMREFENLEFSVPHLMISSVTHLNLEKLKVEMWNKIHEE